MEGIKVICVDVDCCLTSGHFFVSEKGEITKSFHTRDFWAMEKLVEKGYRVIVITASQDECVDRKVESLRCMKVYYTKAPIVVYHAEEHGDRSKEKLVEYFAQCDNLNWNNIAYLGDAENDLECIKKASFSVCPNDAILIIRENVDFVLDTKGGCGAFYEFAKIIMETE